MLKGKRSFSLRTNRNWTRLSNQYVLLHFQSSFIDVAKTSQWPILSDVSLFISVIFFAFLFQLFCCSQLNIRLPRKMKKKKILQDVSTVRHHYQHLNLVVFYKCKDWETHILVIIKFSDLNRTKIHTLLPLSTVGYGPLVERLREQNC